MLVAAVTDSNEEGPLGFYCHYHQLRLAWLHALVVNMSRWVRIEIETYIAAALQLRCSSIVEAKEKRRVASVYYLLLFQIVELQVYTQPQKSRVFTAACCSKQKHNFV